MSATRALLSTVCASFYRHSQRRALHHALKGTVGQEAFVQRPSWSRYCALRTTQTTASKDLDKDDGNSNGLLLSDSCIQVNYILYSYALLMVPLMIIYSALLEGCQG